MRKLLKWVGIGFAALVILVIGVAIGAGGSTTSDGDSKQIAKATVTASATAEDAAEEEATPPPRVREAPNPNGTYTTNCDYVLGDFSEGPSGYRFIAGGRLRNTGNVGIVAQVKASWEQLGQAPVGDVKRVSIKRGGSKRVGFSVPATQDQIDLHQSADGDCSVKVKIVDSFGKPPFE